MELHTSRFEQLGPAFYTPVRPSGLTRPRWVGRSHPAARLLGLSAHAFDAEELLQLVAGNRLPDNATPLASVYSGHQFGHWAGQLGDGRALLLGERVVGGQRLEVQLKGAGMTPYSRRGDGRAVLRSSIREFLASEAMHALGIPSTRALCVVGADDPVHRERVETAAVVTRLAPSFIRFGHFEHFSHHGDHAALRRLADFVIDHHLPGCRDAEGNPYASLLREVTRLTAGLIAQWQAIGFCHGVMNTDNMSILGLTLDYGPFQFLDAFDPGHVCNHSDHSGRYAFEHQPQVALWNLYCLGQALLPLLEEPQQALDALETYRPAFDLALQVELNAKLGLEAVLPGDDALGTRLLELMARDGVDYPLFWRRLSQAAACAPDPARSAWEAVRTLFQQAEAFDAWAGDWWRRQNRQPGLDPLQLRQRMLARNPQVVLRNHLAELAIADAEAGELGTLERLQQALEHPFESLPGHDDLAALPPPWATHIQISCSS